MIWDIQRQKQRRQLTRVQADGLAPEEYASPIIGVFPSSNGQALAVNSKGMIERWDINTGATIPFGTERWVYSGHTPGAEFVDVAVDPASGIVATAAKLTNVDRLYRKPGEGDWEFCIWDQATGIMRRRWRPTLEELAEGSTEQLTKEKGVVEQRLSIVDGGRALIAASDSVTRLFSVEGKELFVAKNFGTYFAVPNPQATNELMLVMRTGAVAILDLKKLDAWSSAPRDLALTTISDTPQQGVWAPDGQSFYLTFNSGAVAAFDWDGSNLKLTWSSHRLDGSRDTIELDRALSSNATRVKSHADIDMAVRVVGESRRLYVARRVRGTPGKTDLTVLEFQKGGTVKLDKTRQKTEKGIYWLDDVAADPGLNPQLHSKLRVDTKQVSARSRVKDQIYITTNTANVFRLQPDSETFASYGNEQLLSVTANYKADVLIGLYADGSLKRFELADADKPWKPCGYTAVGGTRIALSPDGKQLAVLGQENQQSFVRIVDAQSGAEVLRVNGAVAVTWDPQSQANGAIAYADGKIETFVGHTRTAIDTQALVGDASIKDIHFMVESWHNPQEKPVQHLVIHTERDNAPEIEKAGQIQFVPLVGQPTTAAEDRKFENLITIGKGARVTVSPTEAVIVSGDTAGTVKLWFASPTWDHQPKELYELDGHRGAVIELATFNADGTTLISADSKNRVYGWLSRDTERKSAP